MKRVLCVWLPNWPLQRLQTAGPELKGQPVVLYADPRNGGILIRGGSSAKAGNRKHSSPRKRRGQKGRGNPASRKRADRTLQVVACSSEAGRVGVQPGMPLAEARSLLEETPGSQARRQRRASSGATEEQKSEPPHQPAGPHFERYDPAADFTALTKLAQRCQRFSPLVGLDESEAPDSLLLDITGCAHLFGGEPRLAGQVVRTFDGWGLYVRVAVADTVGSAWAVARFGYFRELSQRRGSRSAVVAPGRHVDVLPSLPVEALRLPPESVQALHQFDIRRIDQLLAIPRTALPSRFSPALACRLDQAMGHLPETITPLHPPEPVQAAWPLEHPTADRHAVRRIVGELIEEIAERLGRRQEGAQQLRCTFQIVGGEPMQLCIGLVHPSASAAHLYELMNMQLERTTVAGEIACVDLCAELTAPLQSQQARIFETRDRHGDRRQLFALVDRMTSRLGEQAVLRPRLAADAQPEYESRYEPLLSDGYESDFCGFDASVNEPPRSGMFRPLSLKSRPLRVRAISVVPDGPPVRFGWSNRVYTIVESWGPERIETGWWRRRPIRRDYYRVETDDGRRFWLFRDIEQGSWFLHGLFE